MPTNPTLQSLIPLAVDENGSSVLIGTITPVQAGDALTLNYDPTTMFGTLSIVGTNVFYTAATGGPPITEQISYSVSEAGFGTSDLQSGSFVVEPAPALTAVTLTAPVEVGQSVVIGTVAVTLPNDPLTLSNVIGLGSVTLGGVANGVQQILYTAPAGTGGAAADTVSYTLTDAYGLSSSSQALSVALDPGLTYVAGLPNGVESGQSTVIAVLTPGLLGDTLTLTAMNKAAAAGLSIGPLLANGTEQLIYTAPAGVTTTHATTLDYTVEDQHVGGHSYVTAIQLVAGPVVTPVIPTGNLENGQSVVIGSVKSGLAGDTLAITQSGAFLGAVSLGAADANGVQQILYTAPAHILANALEAVSYSITDGRGSPATSGAASVQLDYGVIITSTGPHVLSIGQSAVVDTITTSLPGDVVKFTKTFSSLGNFTLEHIGGSATTPNTYTVTYHETGAFSTFRRDYATFQVGDRVGGKLAGDGPVIRLDPLPPVIVDPLVTPVEKGQSVVISTVAPGTPGDTFTLSQTGAIAGTLALAHVGGVEEVVYTAPSSMKSSGADLLKYTVTDENGGTAVSNLTYVRLDAGPSTLAFAPAPVVTGQSTVIGVAYAGLVGDTLTLTQTGTSLGTVTLNGNKIVYTAAANVPSTSVSTDAVSYTISDQHNGVTLAGVAAVKILGAPATTGNAAIDSTAFQSFYDLASGAPTMTFKGANSAVLLEGSSSPMITDNAIGLTVDVASSSVSATLANFVADARGVIDLLNGVGGYTSAAAAQSALVSDGNGGSTLALGSGSLHFLATSSIAVAHFKIG